MANRINFTKSNLDKLIPDSKKIITYLDTKVRALQIEIRPTGSMKFKINRRINGKPTRVVVGEYPYLSPEKARSKAMGILALIAEGIDPNEVKRLKREEKTFEEMWAIYQAFLETKAHKKPLTARKNIKAYNLILRSCQPLRKKKSGEITHEVLVDFHRDYSIVRGSPTVANNLIRAIKACFNFHKISPNPAERVKFNKSKSRSTRMKAHHLKKFLPALLAEPSIDMRDLFLLCLFTGQRIGFIQSMQWDNINIEENTWEFISKNSDGLGDEVTIPLIQPAIDLLLKRKQFSDEWVFPAQTMSGYISSPQKAFERILKRAGLPAGRNGGFTPHDLRRTATSLLAEDNASNQSLLILLGNKSESTLQIYSRPEVGFVKDQYEGVVEKMLESIALP